nr:Ycf91 [Tsunamia transpacifica]
MIHLNEEVLKAATSIDMKLSQITYQYEPNQYFLIYLDYDNSLIHTRYIHKEENLNELFIGNTARILCHQILTRFPSNINNLHAAYLGRELMKAEISLILKQKYVQS